MDDEELEKQVDVVFKTPAGGILRMKNGAAVVLRGGDAEVLSSLEEFHLKYKDDALGWAELTGDEARRKMYAAHAGALTKLKWPDVEAVVEAAQNLEAAENRKSLIDLFYSSIKEALHLVVSFPFVILPIWAIAIGAKPYSGIELSGLQWSLISGLAAAVLLRCVPKNPGRITFALSAVGYLLIAVIWAYY